MASEVLKVSHTAGVTNSESVLINGVSGHTYTILSITICETDYEILSDQAVGANETFVFNDRLVLTDTDHLCIQAGSSANIDVVVSYLDQTR